MMLWNSYIWLLQTKPCFGTQRSMQQIQQKKGHGLGLISKRFSNRWNNMSDVTTGPAMLWPILVLIWRQWKSIKKLARLTSDLVVMWWTQADWDNKMIHLHGSGEQEATMQNRRIVGK